MIAYFAGFFLFLSSFIRSRSNLGLEIVALRQQLGVLKRKKPRPRLRIQDRLFWTLLRRLWPGWSNVLVLVKPETLSLGIELPFVCSGAYDHGQGGLAGQ